MNERIKEIEKQCWQSTQTEPYAWFDSKKFADLLIQECARVARDTPCPYLDEELRQRLGHTWDMASLEAGREIVKHFGVEE